MATFGQDVLFGMWIEAGGIYRLGIDPRFSYAKNLLSMRMPCEVNCATAPFFLAKEAMCLAQPLALWICIASS